MSHLWKGEPEPRALIRFDTRVWSRASVRPPRVPRRPWWRWVSVRPGCLIIVLFYAALVATLAVIGQAIAGPLP